MAQLTPFRALRYDFPKIGTGLADRIAPPYDVLDDADKRRLLRQSDRNIVAIDLPHAPAKSLGPSECYKEAAKTLEQWIADRTLVREPIPAIYIYHQIFKHLNEPYTRRMFIARIRLEPFSAGNVLPHEQTFGGPKEDRLALMKTTRCNLSSIFALFPDADEAVGNLLDSHTRIDPDATATLDDVQNRLWVLTETSAVASVVDALAEKQVYIADGHHRYNTALMYREWLQQQQRFELPDDHPANFVMIVFGSMNDPGSLILPTHRVLTELPDCTLDDFTAALADGCEKCNPTDADIIIHHGPSGRDVPVKFTGRSALDSLEPNMSPAWRELDVAYLHRYLIDELLTSQLLNNKPPAIKYIKAEPAARKLAAAEKGFALICIPPTMSQLRAVSQAGDLMPQKSTYFYPKVATGLTINPLY